MLINVLGDRTMHDDDGMRVTIRYYYDDEERATPDSHSSSQMSQCRFKIRQP
jgi:hypothetical protein